MEQANNNKAKEVAERQMQKDTNEILLQKHEQDTIIANYAADNIVGNDWLLIGQAKIGAMTQFFEDLNNE